MQTAFREAFEETGIIVTSDNFIGTLTPLYIPVSNIVVTPYIAWLNKKPDFKPDTREVVHIIEATLQKFTDCSIIKTKPFYIRGEMINIKYYEYLGNVIWGATAMMLHELMFILRRGSIILPG
jgi:hypothetical protein